MMSQPRRRGTPTDLAWRRMQSRLLCCRWRCSSSPCQEGIADCLVHYPTYSNVGHNPHNIPTMFATPSSAVHNIHPCGARSEAPRRPWDDGSRHGRWVHGLARQKHTSQDTTINQYCPTGGVRKMIYPPNITSLGTAIERSLPKVLIHLG